MKYLYGDATESPIRLNYIELLRDVLDFAVGVLAAEDVVHKLARRAAREEQMANGELRQLRQVAHRMGKTVDSLVRKQPLPKTLKCLDAIRGAALAEIKRAESTIRQQLTTEQTNIKHAMVHERAENLARLEKLLKVHDLPDSDTWAELKLAGEGYVAELVGRAPCRVDYRLALGIPADHLFAEPVRIDRLDPQLAIKVPEEAGWVRKSIKLRTHKLTKEHLVGMSRRAGTTIVSLRNAPDGGDGGYDLTFDHAGTPRSVRRYHKGGASEPFAPDGDDVAKLRQLGSTLSGAVDELRAIRSRLIEAQLDGKPLAEHGDPGVLVDRLVSQLAPIIQEIAQRSLSPTELVLKRVLADDRREEIFASKQDLLDKIQPLPARMRKRFAPLGLLPDDAASDDDAEEEAASAPPSAPDLLRTTASGSEPAPSFPAPPPSRPAPARPPSTPGDDPTVAMESEVPSSGPGSSPRAAESSPAPPPAAAGSKAGSLLPEPRVKLPVPSVPPRHPTIPGPPMSPAEAAASLRPLPRPAAPPPPRRHRPPPSRSSEPRREVDSVEIVVDDD